jgi:hypothetical protein
LILCGNPDLQSFYTIASCSSSPSQTTSVTPTFSPSFSVTSRPKSSRLSLSSIVLISVASAAVVLGLLGCLLWRIRFHKQQLLSKPELQRLLGPQTPQIQDFSASGKSNGISVMFSDFFFRTLRENSAELLCCITCCGSRSLLHQQFPFPYNHSSFQKIALC